MFKFICRLYNFKIRGKKNKVTILGGKKRIFYVKGLKVDIKGKNNKVIIHMPQNFENVKIIIRGENNFVEIFSSIYFIKNTTFYLDSKSNSRVMTIGRDFLCAGAEIILALHNSQFSCGEECMFSYGLHIRNHDGHVIYDKETLKPIGHPKNIQIGNHVWIGYRSVILRGVKIGSYTIIGACSLVTKDCGNENSIYAGIPAKPIKTGINWSHENIDNYHIG